MTDANPTTTIIGIAGSLRKGSFNAALLRAAAEATSRDTRLEIASIREIPLYDGDLEAERGIPESVQKLKDRLASADGLLLVTPEYNNSIPGVFKNAIDWLSRPSKDIGRVFGNRAVAVMGATPGSGGTVLAQTAWLPVLRTLGMRPWFGARMLVSDASRVFDDAGNLVDEQVRSRLKTFMAGFEQFVGGTSVRS
jgi:chromate reductase, NAD(P)H dehydrogenase (quinone)